MKNNILSLVLLTAITLCAPLQAAEVAAAPANIAPQAATCKPNVPRKKRKAPTKFSMALKYVKNKLNRNMRKAKKNWASFAKENPGKAKALEIGTYALAATIVIGVGFKGYQLIQKARGK